MRKTRTIHCRLFVLLRITSLILILFNESSSISQVFDDFSDGDFSASPAWIGDTTDFIISYSNAVPQDLHPSLQLNSSGSDTSCLVVAGVFTQEAEWQFWVKLSFNTSSNNFARMYLVSDQQDLGESLDGYFIQIGGSADSLMLCKQTGAQIETLITGVSAFSGNSTNVFRIKVIHDEEGVWHLLADPTGGNNFILEGTYHENSFSDGIYTGIFCQYTSSNSSKFYFDDFYMGNYIKDSVPPELVSLEILSPNDILLEFSEPLELNSAQNTSNYSINPGIGSPDSTILLIPDYHLVSMVFSNSLQEGIPYILEIENLLDIAGNILGSVYQEVTYLPPALIQPYDVLINELLADLEPPPVNLPVAEYIELYNRTDFPININSLLIQLKQSADPVPLPSHLLDPGQYVILTEISNTAVFEPYGQVVGIDEFVLNNEGIVGLLTPEGENIHSVEYNKAIFKSDTKKEGGWALEQIDPFNPCSGINNWSESISGNGGTPGGINSIDAENIVPFKILHAICLNDSIVSITLNHNLLAGGNLDADNIEVDQGIGSPILIQPVDSFYNGFHLFFKKRLLPGRIYTIHLKDVQDCIGKLIPPGELFPFGLDEYPEEQDLVINEVLFDPAGEGVDFVEVYNRSMKNINLKHLKIGNLKIDPFEITDTNYKEVSASDHLILMGEYMVFCTDPRIVQDQYFSHDPERFCMMESFPAYPNEEGMVLLANDFGKVLDHMIYNVSMHHPLLNQVEGVSLERISYHRPSGDQTNWHSASSTSGYATPGIQNSQYSGDNFLTDKVIQVIPEVFSPDNDGHDDLANIHYQFPEAGYSSTLLIFDASGRPVRVLINNELLGSQGTISWDGKNETKQKVPLGIYLLYLEAFEPGGHIIKEKKVLVVGGK